MKITERQLRRIIRESIIENRKTLDEGIFSGLTAMVAQKFGKLGKVEDPGEEKKKMGQAISRYITSVIQASKDDESMKGEEESEIKGGALEAAKKSIEEIITAWEKGGN